MFVAGRPILSALAFAALGLASSTHALEVVGAGKARFTWEEATGPVAAYLVYVSRNGAAFPPFPEQAVRTPSAEVPGQPGETVVVAVAALTQTGLPGPLSERSHPVRFTTTPSPPAIGVGPDVLFSNATPGEYLPPLAFEVVNTGGGRLDFEVTTATPWLRATPTSGTSATSDVPVTLTVDATGLAPGLHFSAAYVRAPGIAAPGVVPVVLSVFPPVPEFATSARSVSIPALLGDGAEGALLTVSGSLPDAAYGIVSDAPWLSTGLSEGARFTGERTLLLEADPTGLPRGTHSTHVHLVPEDPRALGITVDVTLTVVDPSAPPRPVPDLNGDGRADLLFRDRVTGDVTPWLMSGATRLASARLAGPVPATDWALAAVADLDADGRAEILWNHVRLGAVMAWFMNGVTRTRTAALPTLGEAGWQLVGADDFDGDRRTDLLWHHPATGRLRILRLVGTASAGAFDPERVGESVAAVIGTGDFDATGTADVVWRAAGGGVRIWLSKPGSAGSIVPLEAPPEAGWEIVGVADQDGDGKSDLVWRSDALRETQLWRFESPTVIQTGPLPDLRRPGHRIAATLDLDGDGETDLLWRSTATGLATAWMMEGFDLRLGASMPGTPLPAWEIQP